MNIVGIEFDPQGMEVGEATVRGELRVRRATRVRDLEQLRRTSPGRYWFWHLLMALTVFEYERFKEPTEPGVYMAVWSDPKHQALVEMMRQCYYKQGGEGPYIKLMAQYRDGSWSRPWVINRHFWNRLK